MSFFEHGDSGDDAHYWADEDTKMAWTRETKVMIFMQMELEACLDEVDWMVRCHNHAPTIAQRRNIRQDAKDPTRIH